jgi:hypothetical protein
LTQIADNIRVYNGYMHVVSGLQGVQGPVEIEHAQGPGKILQVKLMMAAHGARFPHLVYP